LEYYKDKKEEFNYYQTLNIDITMVNGYVGDPKITEKRETYSSFFEIKTKYNSRLKIELLICRRKTNLNAAWENNDITESIKNILTDSLEQFSMSEMYYGGKHMALEEMIKNIIATYDNETRWVKFHPQIPEDVERKWNELSNERIESLKKIILLDKKLKSNENLSKEMKKEIEKNIIKLEENIKLIKQREAEARKV
jgi:Fe2+ transport system protein B